MDLSKITVSEIQLSYMDAAGHIRVPTEEDASYVTLDPDDLVVISGTDDDVPIKDEDHPATVSDLLDDDVFSSEHLLRKISACPGLAPWGFPFPTSSRRRGTRGPRSPRSSRGSRKKPKGRQKAKTRTRRRVHFQPASSLEESTSVSISQLDVHSAPVDAGLIPDHADDSPDLEDDLDLPSLQLRLHELPALDPLLRATKQSRSAFYEDFYRRDSEDSCTKGRAHVDGGA